MTPAELKEVVSAYQDKGDANGVKQVQSTGIHIAGERFVTLKADERSLYGKKVRRCLQARIMLAQTTTRSIQPRLTATAGPGRGRDRKDYPGPSCRTLSRISSTWQRCQHCRATRRLFDQGWILRHSGERGYSGYEAVTREHEP